MHDALGFQGILESNSPRNPQSAQRSETSACAGFQELELGARLRGLLTRGSPRVANGKEPLLARAQRCQATRAPSAQGRKLGAG